MADFAGWWSEIDAVLEEKSLLKHAFYRAWTEGRLSRADLAEYSRQYYQQEARFPRYLSAVHSNCPELSVRQSLLENLSHEEQGPENHPELWLRFAEAVGASRESVLGAQTHPKTEACVRDFSALTREGHWTEGLAALYAYEAQQPAVAATKIDGLKRHYGLDSEAALGFFKVHQELDLWHSEVERRALTAAVTDEGDRARIKAAVSRACDALNTLLDGVCEARGIACH